MAPRRLGAALFLWYLFAYVLLPLPEVGSGLDNSWRAFLTWAFLHHKQFGSEVVFTYGPWGFLIEPVGTIQAYPWQLIGRGVLALGMAAGISLVAEKRWQVEAQRWRWAFVIAILAEPTAVLPALLFACTFCAEPDQAHHSPMMWLVALAAGLAACTKFTGFLMLAALTPLLLFRRQTWGLAAISVSSFFLFWFVAQQSPGNIGVFIASSMQVSSGYASAMVNNPPLVRSLVGGLVCGLPLLALARQVAVRPSVLRVVQLAWLGVFALMTFRHGIIRADEEHTFMALLGTAIPMALIVLALTLGEAPHAAPRWRNAAILCLFATSGAAANLAWGEVQRRAAGFVDSVRLYPAYFRELASPRRQGDAAAGKSVDVFPNELSYAIHRGLNLRNRPVFQSYAAFSTNLSVRNAAFLEGRDGPDEVYFQSAPIDGRYPTMEDTMTWRSLLTHYLPSETASEFLVLRRRTLPVRYGLRLLLERTFVVGETVEIPDGGNRILWAELQLDRNSYGRLMDVLFRKDKMVLHLETGEGWQAFRLLDETVGSGFLLSPYVKNLAAMRELYGPSSEWGAAEAIRRLRVDGDGRIAHGYEREMRIRVHEMTR